MYIFAKAVSLYRWRFGFAEFTPRLLQLLLFYFKFTFPVVFPCSLFKFISLTFTQNNLSSKWSNFVLAMETLIGPDFFVIFNIDFIRASMVVSNGFSIFVLTDKQGAMEYALHAARPPLRRRRLPAGYSSLIGPIIKASLLRLFPTVPHNSILLFSPSF